MSNEANAIDVLSEDLSGVSTAMPLLAEGVYDMRVKKIEKVLAKDQTNHNIKIRLDLIEPARDVDGGKLNAGFPVFDIISLKITDEYDPRPALKRFQVSAGVTGAFEPLSQYQDKVVKVAVKIQPESTNKTTGETYPPANRVKAYVPIGK